jgi:1,4-dihydroxy-2-naphthoate octaprenyltransferase
LKKFIEKIRLWLIIGREYTLHQSILPYIFAVIIAAKNYHVNLLLSVLGLIGVVLAHMSVNILDDYFDWKKGAVEEYKKLIDKGLKARTHKCFYLEEGLTTPKTILTVALSMDFVAVLIGLFIAYKVGFIVLVIAAIAGFLGFFYSAPPIKLSYRGLVEMAIGIIFGPLLMIGTYITAGGVIDKTILFASLIFGLLIANIAHTHAIMDFPSDVKSMKKSLAVRCGSQNNAIILQGLIFAIAYIFTAVGIIFHALPVSSTLVFVTIPKSFALVKMMKSDFKTKKWWMGILEDWERHEKEGSDWFMMRLCLSRNIVSDFAVILGITYFLFK